MKEKHEQFQTKDVSPSREIPIYTLCILGGLGYFFQEITLSIPILWATLACKIVPIILYRINHSESVNLRKL